MHNANSKRYETMEYRKCGDSGLKLPAVSLGLWHNFGDKSDFENMCQICFSAFDNGITHFDLANNYGPLPGAAEKRAVPSPPAVSCCAGRKWYCMSIRGVG